jgi:hypothetical protein
MLAGDTEAALWGKWRQLTGQLAGNNEAACRKYRGSLQDSPQGRLQQEKVVWDRNK